MVSNISTTSTYWVYDMRRDIVGRLNNEIDRASTELATGRHAAIFEAAGANTSRAFDLRGDLQRTEGFLVSNRLIEARLDTTKQTLTEIRKVAEEFLTLAAQSAGGKSSTTEMLQENARRAFDRIAELSNTSYSGSRLLAGVAADQSALTRWAETAGGTTPEAVVAGIVGGTITDTADAAAKSAALDDVFADAAGPGFSDVFYGGAPRDGARLTAQISQDVRLEFGVQADEQGFRDLMQGLAMFTTIDVSQIADTAGYAAWVDEAMSKLGQGVGGVLALEVEVGTDQARLEDEIDNLSLRRDILNSERGEIEGVDPYDAALRLSDLEARLEATYTVTARLQNLTFLNFI